MQLNRQRQLTLIANYLQGIPPDRAYHHTDFDRDLAEAWRECDGWALPDPDDAETAGELRFAVQQRILAYAENGARAWADILAVLTANAVTYLSLAELAATLEPITWLWPDWLPIGMISMLAARPGTGKSLVALDLCRRIIAGEAWPDGQLQARTGERCIYVDAENVPSILNARAQQWEQWGMDRTRIYPLIPEQDQDIVNLGGEHYRDLLWSMTYRLKPALIVLDSLRDILPAGESAVEDVRSTMAYLSNLAVQNNTAVLIIHHLRKSANTAQLALFDTIDLDQVSGSGYIAGRARVVMGLTKVQTGPRLDKNGPRKIEVIKTNLGHYPADLGITFEELPPDGLRLLWSTDAPERYEPPTERDEAADWLLQYLAGETEPIPVKTVAAAAKEAGYSRATLYRVRDELADRIINTKGRKHPANAWSLADKEAA